MFTTLRKMHEFFAGQLVYPIILSITLALSIYIGRVIFTGNWLIYRFLVWNLFLAWIPYFFSVFAAATYRLNPKSWWMLLLPGTLWLVFFPNAPYILTDLLHVGYRPPVPFWYVRLARAMPCWGYSLLPSYHPPTTPHSVPPRADRARN